MRTTKRKVVLAAVLGAAVVAAAVPMVVSGTASAQSGSRLCGRFWASRTTGEVVTKLYEVYKYDIGTCNHATAGQTPGDSPFTSQLRDKAYDSYFSDIITLDVCENWKRFTAQEGGLGGRYLVHPDGTKLADQDDICNNMERSNGIGDMERYWLYFNGDPTSIWVELNRN